MHNQELPTEAPADTADVADLAQQTLADFKQGNQPTKRNRPPKVKLQHKLVTPAPIKGSVANYMPRAAKRAQQREAAKEAQRSGPRKIWEENLTMAEQTRQVMDAEAAVLVAFFEQENLRPFIPVDQLQAVDKGMEVLRSDYLTFQNIYNELFDQHKDRTGPAKDAQDEALAAEVFGRYIDMLNRYASVVTPNVQFLMSVMAATEDAVHAAVNELKEKGIDVEAAVPSEGTAEEAATTTEQPIN